MLGVIGVLVAIALVIFLAYRGWGIIPASLMCSLIVILTNGCDIWTSISVSYAEGLKYFISAYFMIFILGALFGKVMGDSGAASAISYKLLDLIGASKAVLVIVLATAVLTYGGVNLFIVVFTVYPIALILFKAADLPKRLIVASIGLGAATFTMTALPGSPAIQNLIPAQVLQTTPTAAPLIGIVTSILMLAIGYWYIVGQTKKAQENGEKFIAAPRDNIENLVLVDTSQLPDWKLSFVPLIVVLVIIFVLKNMIDPIFTVSIALTVGILLTYIFFWKRFANPLKSLNEGATNSIMALINTAAIVGFGFVVQSVPAFQSFVEFALGLQFHPLVSAAVSVNLIAGITGSASGGLTIFMKTLGPEYVKMGLNPEVLHRICSIASGGLDSLPHSGAVITLFAVMGVSHKEGYKDLGMVTLVIPILVTIVSIIMAVTLY